MRLQWWGNDAHGWLWHRRKVNVRFSRRLRHVVVSWRNRWSTSGDIDCLAYEPICSCIEFSVIR